MDDKEFEIDLASVKRELRDDRAVDQRRTPQQTHAKNTIRLSGKKRKMQRRRRLLAALTGLALILLIVLIVLVVKSCSADTSLAGTWRIDDTVYEFDGKGSGVLHTSLNDYAFTYTVEDDTLRIDFASSAATDTAYQYSIKGNTLTFERGGEIYKLTKD